MARAINQVGWRGKLKKGEHKKMVYGYVQEQYWIEVQKFIKEHCKKYR